MTVKKRICITAFSQKPSTLSSLIIGVLGKRCEGKEGGEESLNIMESGGNY